MQAVVVGTAGHIDHGKSALVRALTGTNPDRLKEEQARGITIDLGFAHLDVDDTTIAFVDVPGHERFVRNMLAGAGGIDAVMLVVAADESVMPQTREHFEICRLLGLRRGLIALSKVDLVDAETRELVALEVREFVHGSFLEQAPIIPVSARTGTGLGELRAALGALAGGTPRQARAGIVRLPVDRVFSVHGFGTVITGTLVSGAVADSDELLVLPGERRVRIRGVQVHGETTRRAVAPGRVALNLGAVDVTELARGVTLTSKAALAVTRRVDLRLELLASARPLAHGARVRLHHGTSEMLGRVSIAAIQRPAGATWQAAAAGEAGLAVPSGGRAYVRLRLDTPAVLTRGDRVVFRAFSPLSTIGGGVVLDPDPPRGRLRRQKALERFDQLEELPTAVRLWIRESGGIGLATADLVRRGGLEPSGADEAARDLSEQGMARLVNGRLYAAEVADRLRAAIPALLRTFHEAHPREAGMPRDEVRHRAGTDVSTALFDAVVAAMAQRREVAGADRLRLPSHDPGLDAAQLEAAHRVLRALDAAGLQPPDLEALAASIGLPPTTVRELIPVLTREGRVRRVGDLVFHPDPLAGLAADIRGLGAGRTVDVAAFKERFGLSRKFAIPLLEWLDRERVTRRQGDVRVVL